MALSRQWQRALAVTLFFALLAGVAMFPLSAHLNSRVPGAPPESGRVLDYYHFHWNLWWLRYAFLRGENIWYTNKVLAPFTHNLTYHSLTASMLPFYLVLEPLLGHLRSANAIIWISLALTGALMTGFLRWRGIRWPMALAGGIALAFSPYMLDHAGSGHLNLLTAWWLPIVLFAWEKTVRTRRLCWAILTGLVLWGMWFTDTLIVFWGGLLLGPWALYALWRAPDWRERARLIGLGGLALALTVTLSWFLGPLQPTLDFDTSQLPPARLLTLRYYSLAFDSLYLPRLGSAQKVGTEHDETLGLTLVVLTVIGLFVRTRNRERWFWLLAALPALILTLGPDVEVLGVRVPLPFRLIHEAFGGQMRTPIRFLPPATAALVIYLAHTWDDWLREHPRLPGRAIVTGGILFLLLDYGVFVPFPTLPALQPYQFHWMMRQEHYDDYDYVVLDVPSGPFTGWRDVGSHPEAMVYGITHEKRQVSGLLSRIPINQHLFYEQNPLLGWLTGSRPLDASAAASDLNKFVQTWPIGYIVVHLDWLEPARAQEVLAFFNAQRSVCPVTVERDAVLYRTISHPKGCPPRTPPATAAQQYTVMLGEPTPAALMPDAPFVGYGWYPPEDIGGEHARWTGAGEALLYADLPPGSAYRLTLRAVAFDQPRAVRVVVGNVGDDGQLHSERLGTLTIAPGDWREYTLTISAELVNALGGRLALSLAADGALSAAQVGLSDDTRPLAVAYDWVRFEAVPGE